MFDYTMSRFLSEMKSYKTAVRLTQHRDLIDTFYAKTYDDVTISLSVYEDSSHKWYIIIVGSRILYTQSAYHAFYVIDNCSVYTCQELEGMIR